MQKRIRLPNLFYQIVKNKRNNRNRCKEPLIMRAWRLNHSLSRKFWHFSASCLLHEGDWQRKRNKLGQSFAFPLEAVISGILFSDMRYFLIFLWCVDLWPEHFIWELSKCFYGLVRIWRIIGSEKGVIILIFSKNYEKPKR